MHHYSHVLPQTIIPIQLTLLGMHRCSHVLSQSFSKAVVLTIAVKVLGMLQHTDPLSLNWSWYWETFIYSSCQNAQFLKSKNRQKMINSSTKCLISVKIAILTPHIIPPPLVNGWNLICRNMSTDCVFWKSIHAFKEHISFLWIYSQLQIHTMLLFCMYPQPTQMLIEYGISDWMFVYNKSKNHSKMGHIFQCSLCICSKDVTFPYIGS